MNMLEYLNEAIRYVEDNLCGEIDPAEVARIACTAQDSFLRFFSYMTGMTLNEYIRKRRLTLAAQDLCRGGERVIDVAVRYGYDSADAFSRAFVRQHGALPSAVRRGEASFRAVPPASFHIMIKGAKEMEMRWIDVQETTVCGISKAFDRTEYATREALRSSMWNECCDDVPGQLCKGAWNQPGSTAYDGLWYGVWRDGRYMIAREPKDVQKVPPECWTIAAGRYVAFSTECGALAWEALPRLFELIFESWLPASGCKLRNDDIIEVYHLWTDREMRKNKRYYEVWIPVDWTCRKRLDVLK